MSLINNPYFLNITSGIVAGIISGIIVGFSVLFFQRKIERKDRIKKYTITNDLIQNLSPGINYKKSRELLGEPHKTYDDLSIFGNDDTIFKSDFYRMNNGLLKITTIDEKSIYALTIFCYEKIEIPFYEFFNGNTEMRLTKDFIDNCSNYSDIRTIRDCAFSIQVGLGAPLYKYLTLFTYVVNESNEIQDYIGQSIEGFCLSDADDAFYIYDYEYR